MPLQCRPAGGRYLGDALVSDCADFAPFALQVIGDDMAPEFPAGSVVVAEPGALLSDGCYVIARVGDDYLLRELQSTRNGWQLRALDVSLPQIPLADLTAIRGRVIQRAGRGRRERKRYL